VEANSEQPEQVASQTWTVDKDKEFLFGIGHMHSGALNVSLFHNGQFVCASCACKSPCLHCLHSPLIPTLRSQILCTATRRTPLATRGATWWR